MMDSLDADKMKFAAEALDLAKQLHNKQAAAIISGAVYNSLKNPNYSDLFKYGTANYSAGNYKTADSIFCGVYNPNIRPRYSDISGVQEVNRHRMTA